MLRSVTAAFSEPEDFESALHAEGCIGLLITGRGRFRARLTQVSLQVVHLTAAEEQMSRIAFFGVPPDTILLIFQIGYGASPVCGGIGMRAGEIMTLSPGAHAHARVDGVSHWGAIHLPVWELVKYGVALTEGPFPVPTAIQRWRPRRSAVRDLRSLHAAAIRMASAHPQTLIDPEAARGLEQQLIHAVVKCLSVGPAEEATRLGRRQQETMVHFEHLLRAQPDGGMRLAEICLALDISGRLLRRLCGNHLRMSPTSYDRLRRMSLVRRALRQGDPRTASLSEIESRFGFRDPDRFAVNYRAAFGESPSATFQRRYDGLPVGHRFHQKPAGE
jgi:AraC-like DNA-binding protein